MNFLIPRELRRTIAAFGKSLLEIYKLGPICTSELG